MNLTLTSRSVRSQAFANLAKQSPKSCNHAAANAAAQASNRGAVKQFATSLFKALASWAA